MDAPNWMEHETKYSNGEETDVRFPELMLMSKSVARMIVFSSKEEIYKLSLTSNMYLYD